MPRHPIAPTVRMLCLTFVLFAFGCTGACAESYAWDFLKDWNFKKSYFAMLGPKVKIPWLAKLDGPASPIEYIQIGSDGEEFIVVNSCQPHACDTNSIVILYSTKHKIMYAKLVLPSGKEVLGTPSAEVKDTLDELTR